MDILQLDRTAVLESVRILEAAGPVDWELPTPCSQWTLRQLVEHMTAQHHGFAAAARGEADELAAWQSVPLGDDPLAGYRASAEAVIAAFAEPGVLVRHFTLPEITTAITFPGRVAVGFHFLDYVAHSWDVAAALGKAVEPSTEAAEAALAIAMSVPDDERRRTPDAQFQPSLQAAPGATTFELFLRALGRSPDWQARSQSSPPPQEDGHAR
ncbi:TIGR03086 family protein [Streptacidiphilus sp. PB12-B1b]|uniref:TIGR03086 family metal-binding protein n=1 Tax=Streptacidiphilus sp. PB12-B1b TaxID=2705012 RepID=UPI0015F9F6C7|nr:TIGR03086 family metal-binding protein [Streptacidiphilus sp. PB12-B1b]QMU75747.1 TIGR03086 family protein [Streptacidiphilus sp. PB12-B1b]